MNTEQSAQAKTKSSLRTLPLIGSFREQVKEAQELNKKICGNCYNYEYDGFVFVDEMGERMKMNYLTSAFPKFLKSHGLRRMRFHDIRHSCASLLFANGVPLKPFRSGSGTVILPRWQTYTPTLITALKSPRQRQWKQGLLCPKAVISEVDGRMAKTRFRRAKMRYALTTCFWKKT